jgi:hypothetical protein
LSSRDDRALIPQFESYHTVQFSRAIWPVEPLIAVGAVGGRVVEVGRPLILSVPPARVVLLTT